MDVDDALSDEGRSGPSTQAQRAAGGGQTDSEGSGDDLRPGNAGDDSSEEEEENSEEERKIREGFIVDEEEDDPNKKRKRKKKRRKERTGEDFVGALDEEDLELLEQNTGRKLDRPGQNKYKRIRRMRDASPASDDLDRPDEPRDLGLFDEDEDLAGGLGGFIDDDMGDFIEDEEDSDGGGERRGNNARRKQNNRNAAPSRRTGFGIGQAIASGGLKGFSAEMWEEINEIFGNSEEYAWAMEEPVTIQSTKKLDMADVFEPAEIKERMLTVEDDEIRALDVPERIQLLGRKLPTQSLQTGRGATQSLFIAEEKEEAAHWIASRISSRLTDQYFEPDPVTGILPRLREHYMRGVKQVLHELTTDFREVPYIVQHRKDFLMLPAEESGSQNMLEYNDVWMIQQRAYEYRALLDRKAVLLATHNRLDLAEDHYFSDLYHQIQDMDQANDVSLWMNSTYSHIMREQRASALKEIQAQAEAEAGPGASEDKIKALVAKKTGTKTKKAVKKSAVERAKDSDIGKFAPLCAIPARVLAQHYLNKSLPLDEDRQPDPEGDPVTAATNQLIPGSEFFDPSVVLEAVKVILVHDVSIDPYLRQRIRQIYKTKGVVTVRPTEKGSAKIDRFHPFSVFKYLTEKPVSKFDANSQFLEILAAEADGLVKVDIHLARGELEQITRDLEKVYLRNEDVPTAVAWDVLREEVLEVALQQKLLPAAAEFVREKLKEDARLLVARRCTQKLELEIERAPFQSTQMEKGETQSVLAISHGAGDYRTDSVVAVFLDKTGRYRAQFKVDNLQPTPEKFRERNPHGDENRSKFAAFLKEWRPDVVVICGFTIKTKALYYDVESLAQDYTDWAQSQPSRDYEGSRGENPPKLEVVFVNDSIARLYQTSKRAIEEFPDLSQLARYCVALARYAQHPLNEVAALGNQLTLLTLNDHQKYLPTDYLVSHLERCLIKVVNSVGVDINRAVRDQYYAKMLPYICGLGPRKAEALLNKIRAMGGTLLVRQDLINKNLVGEVVMWNASAFLRIDYRFVESASREQATDDQADILDSTRIHPDDYDVARKMASDAEDQDEEDIAAMAHPSDIVKELMRGEAAKLNELRLDDFAVELERLMGMPKRWTLYFVRTELQRPFGEARPPFQRLSNEVVFRMLTGETPLTLSNGLIIPVVVVREIKESDRESAMRVRLDSGVEGFIKAGYIKDDDEEPVYPVGHTIRAAVIGVEQKDSKYMEKEHAIELDCRQSTLVKGDSHYRRLLLPLDPFYDETLDKMETTAAIAKKPKQEGRQRRLIQHSNFRNMGAGQAELFLASQQRGDCVIRPSSRGNDHLACTWKVADGIYQHIDILELDKPEGNDLALGRRLRVGEKKTYTDLDELLHMHIRGMAKKVDEMVQSDKFKGTEEELLAYLKNYQMANPNSPAYGYSWDRKHPGQFNLTFIPKKGSEPKTWPVKVGPESYTLHDGDLPNVPLLNNAFKMQYLIRTQLGGGQQIPQQGGRTPGRHTNPYGGRTPNYGARTPIYQPPTSGGQSPWGGAQATSASAYR